MTQPSLLKFKNVSLFEQEEFGIHRLNFELEPRGRYLFEVPEPSRLNALLGMMEGRYRSQGGFIERSRDFFMQSDRQLLGDKVFDQSVEQRLLLKEDFFFFDGKRRSKAIFLDRLQVRGIKKLPIWKLKGEDKTKFALLSITFQEQGLILISQLHSLDMPPAFVDSLLEVIDKSRCCLCLFNLQAAPDPARLQGVDWQTIEVR